MEEGSKTWLPKTQKRHRMRGVGRSWEFSPHTKTNCAVSREKSCMVAVGALASKGDESAQRLKTPTGSVKPARSLQELHGTQTGNCWVWLNLTLNLLREELAPKSYEQSAEPKGERWRRMLVQLQRMGRWVEGNNFQNTEELFGIPALGSVLVSIFTSGPTLYREERENRITKGHERLSQSLILVFIPSWNSVSGYFQEQKTEWIDTNKSVPGGRTVPGLVY